MALLLQRRNKIWPKHAKAQEMVDEMKGKEFGTVRVSKGTSINGSNTNNLHLVALADSKHASLILTNCSTTIRNGETKKRRVGSELVGFKYGEA